MVVPISANFQGGGHGNDVIWDPNIPQNWKNDNNKGRPPNKELYLSIQAYFGKGKVMVSSKLHIFHNKDTSWTSSVPQHVPQIWYI